MNKLILIVLICLSNIASAVAQSPPPGAIVPQAAVVPSTVLPPTPQAIPQSGTVTIAPGTILPTPAPSTVTTTTVPAAPPVTVLPAPVAAPPVQMIVPPTPVIVTQQPEYAGSTGAYDIVKSGRYFIRVGESISIGRGEEAARLAAYYKGESDKQAHAERMKGLDVLPVPDLIKETVVHTNTVHVPVVRHVPVPVLPAPLVPVRKYWNGCRYVYY